MRKGEAFPTAPSYVLNSTQGQVSPPFQSLIGNASPQPVLNLSGQLYVSEAEAFITEQNL